MPHLLRALWWVPRPPGLTRLSQNCASRRDAGKVAGGEPRSGAAPGNGKHSARAPGGATEVFHSHMHSVAPPGLLIRFHKTPGCAALARGYCLQPFQGWTRWHIIARRSFETVSHGRGYFLSALRAWSLKWLVLSAACSSAVAIDGGRSAVVYAG